MPGVGDDLSVFDNIVYLLDTAGVAYEVLEHEFVHRSEDAAKVRGTKLEEAAKALVLRAKYTESRALRRTPDGASPAPPAPTELTKSTSVMVAADAPVTRTREEQDCGLKKFFMCVVSGNKRMELKKVKELVACKNVALASPEDVLEKTGLKIGTIPPFPALFGVDGYCDASVLENEHVVFSAGSHYKSIRMKSEDWKELAGVVVERFSQ